MTNLLCNLRTLQPSRNGPADFASLNVSLSKTVVVVETEKFKYI